MAWAVKQKTGDPVSKLLLLTLANFANEDGKAWPSINRLVRDTEISKSTVIRKLEQLEAAGLIARKPTYREDGGHAYNVYTLRPTPSVTVTPPLVSEGPDPSVTVTPKPIIEPINTPPGAKPDRLPAGWAPSEAALAWATAAYPNMDLANELEKFTDHFLANGERKLDWTACWRNWIRRAATYHRAPVVRPGRLRGAELDARNAASLRASLDALYREGSEAAPELEPGAGQGRLARPAGGAR